MKAALPLSVAIVCRDNEATIWRTLGSVAGLASEVVALDSGSRDRTIQMLEKFGARVERVQWRGHVRTKQMALEQCKQPWALCLDSDESVTPDLRASIEQTLRSARADVGGYEVNRKVWWGGDFLHHAWQPEWRLRLVRRGCAAWTGTDPHDRLEMLDGATSSEVQRLDGDLRHDAFTNMAEFLGKQVRLSQIAALEQFEAGKRGGEWGLATRPIAAWLKQMIGKRAYKDGWRGWCAASAVAGAALMKHCMLLERTRGGLDLAEGKRQGGAADMSERASRATS
jgi:glycosyltransferase involved in cell wall biosynthesis